MTSTDNHIQSTHHADERRRHDWQENDRRKSKPWVVDISDRRSGRDRRLEQARLATG